MWRFLIFKHVVIVCISLSVTLNEAFGADLTLTILHTNDVHARFLEIDKYGANCGEADVKAGKCFGGFARLHYKVKEIRSTHPNVVYLSGGDYFQGTIWYTLFKWRVMAHFVNQLNHTAMALGNHEFDDNIDGLVPFLEAIQFPVLSCNIEDEHEPTIQGKFSKSIIVEYEGTKVGIIGYTTQETQILSFPGKLKFTDEIDAIQAEAEFLSGQGVGIIIAVGHAGYDVDLKIAENVPFVDVVVGGHTNTFLYTGPQPDIDNPMAEYPTIVTQPNGKKVPVVQAYAFGKYLGYLNVTFDGNGEVKSWNGNPILLNKFVGQDPDMIDDLKVWEMNISSEVKRQVGITRALLEGGSQECRLRECNMGNVITNSMVYLSQEFAAVPIWNGVRLAILNSGGIRSSISETKNNGIVTLEDIRTVLPFQNTVDLIEIKGKHLREAFEFSVVGYDPKGLHVSGKFLQVSGIRVIYNLAKPAGQHVQSLLVMCEKCRIPQYEPLNDTETYKLILPKFIAIGGDGYDMIKNNIIVHHNSESLDYDVLVKYFEDRSPIDQGLEGRISFVNSEPGYAKPGCSAGSWLQLQSHVILNYSLLLPFLLVILSQRAHLNTSSLR